jgi:putative heme-binding domain-containing protein
MLLGATSNSLSQNPDGGSAPKPNAKGKNIFESRCAVCHGLDARGGEHAPNIARSSAAENLSDEALLRLIHDGIPQRGMPAFSDIGKEDGPGLIAHLRFLQGKSAAGSIVGDPIRGQNLFFGKAGCSACHAMEGRGHLTAEDLTGYRQYHRAREIREAILHFTAPETATAIAQDGRKFSGTVRNEDNSSVQLQDRDGRFYLLMKSTVTSIDRQMGTAVHIDYERQLSQAELDDLVSYVLHGAGTSEHRSPGEKGPALGDDDD